MKRILQFLLQLILSLSFLLTPVKRMPLSAHAQTLPAFGSYACVLKDAYFYSEADTRTGLFLLPKTYYVKLVEYGKEFCRIEYLYDSSATEKLLGYAKTDLLTFVDYVPSRPYLYYVFDVRYVLNDTPSQDSAFLNQITVSCAYYGDFSVGSKTYCYVLQGENFGYVPKPETLSFEENTEYADRLTLPTPDKNSSSAEEKKNVSSAQIALLVALCLLVPVLASLIIKPPKRPPYEMDE